jgi:hypothetical protein
MRESRTGQSTFAPSAVKGVIMVGKTPQGRARGIATVYRSCTSRIKLGESINQSDYFQSVKSGAQFKTAANAARKAPHEDTCYHAASTRSLQLPRAVATQCLL